MKISRNWLQNFFGSPLPEAQALADALTFHAFEIEGVDKVEGDYVLDVKVTPNRGHDCLSHRGIAKEISAILDIPLKNDPLRASITLSPKVETVTVVIKEPEFCSRYIAGYIRGVEVGPTKDESIVRFLESVGQQTINNVVDAMNYVMFNLGQPLHAFDALQLAQGGGNKKIVIRRAFQDEPITSLDNKQYSLGNDNLVIADGVTGQAVGIAGVKGGISARVSNSTHDIIIESANFDGASVRKTAAALKLRTDASIRFEQVISPELAAYGVRAAADLIVQLAGGEIDGFVDEYPKRAEQKTVSVSVEKINQILGTELTGADVADVFMRLGFAYKEEGGMFDVIPPFERLDLRIPEDLVEEVGRIIGYDKVPAVQMLPFPAKPEINTNFYSAEHVREDLMSKCYSEVVTSVFADTGERAVLNKVDSVHPYLRSTLVNGLKEAQEKNKHNKDVLGIDVVKIFEIGTVWSGGKEMLMLGIADESVREMPLPLIYGDSYEQLQTSTAARYQAFSRYPSIARDISLWVPIGTLPEDVETIIRVNAGGLLVRTELFDRFEKGEKLSLAFLLVFQSVDRTLTDEDANTRMESVYMAVKGKGWQVR